MDTRQRIVDLRRRTALRLTQQIEEPTSSDGGDSSAASQNDGVQLSTDVRCALNLRSHETETQCGTFVIVLVTSIEKLLVAATFQDRIKFASVTKDKGDRKKRLRLQCACRDLCV